MKTTSSFSKAAALLALACSVAACTPTDSYRGNTPRPSTTLHERQMQERQKNFGIWGGLTGEAIAKLTESKDPGTAPIIPTAGKTEYLEPVASTSKKEPVRTSAKNEQARSDSNGTVFYSE